MVATLPSLESTMEDSVAANEEYLSDFLGIREIFERLLGLRR